MCRIAGIFNPIFPKEQLEHQLIKMCDAQAHGGPDGYGYWFDEQNDLALGHRRLSLLDLSSAGHQPMAFQNLIISFNGEIYNFKEIRFDLMKLGHRFISDSDTEVILHAFSQWGNACFTLFNGMFAIVIYDIKTQKLTLARDLAGVKPLYYYQQNQQFVFASEVKAFQHAGIKFEDDPNWKIYFLSFGFIPEPHTTLKNVKSIKPGHYLEFDLKTQILKEICFDELTFSNTIKDEETAKSLIAITLSQSIQRHLIADAPIGVFLSGGIDSSILSLLAAKNATLPIRTLSVSFTESNYDESRYQNIIQNKINSIHTHYQVTKKDYLNALPQLKTAFDQPSNDAINSWFISKCAKENGLKAVLSGIGGDELFGGYPSFSRISTAQNLRFLPLRIFKIADHLSDDRLKKLVFLSEDKTYADYLFLRGFYTPNSISKLLDATEFEIKETLNQLTYQSPRKTVSPKNYMSWLEQNIYMRSQLLKDTDYMSMQHGVEVRVPFLDKEFLKLIHRIDSNIKFKGKIPKSLLVNSFTDILPKEIYQRKKMGFTFPFQEWNKDHPELGKILNHPNKQVKKLGNLFLNDQLHWSRCYALLQIEKYLPQKDALFLTLKTFSHTGGIEKVNRILMKAGTDIQSENLIRFYAKSLYDHLPDEKYITSRRFKGFRGHLIKFVFRTVKKGINCDVVMFSHINLAVVGLLIKWINPQTKLILQVHGIEVWGKLSYLKRMFLHQADTILSVSNYTKAVIIKNHQLDPAKCLVFHNSLDPYFDLQAKPALVEKLKLKYHIQPHDRVLITLTRLVATEKYKGYDKVIYTLKNLIEKKLPCKYLILGKYDKIELIRIKALIKSLALEKQVFICGFINDDEISSYFNLANVFVMPSQKEGFGIVFIEAMACGLPVIAGNADGSVDALVNGELGTLVNPNSLTEIENALLNYHHHPMSVDKALLSRQVQTYFGYDNYKNKLQQLLLN